MNFTALENAVRAWVVSASGLAADRVIFGHQPGTSPAPAPMISIVVHGAAHVGGPDAEVWSFDPMQAQGEEVVFATQGVRRVPVELQAFGDAVTGAGTARELLSKVQAALSLSTVREALNAAGLGVAQEGSVRWLPAEWGDGFEGRAVLEVAFTARETATAKTGYIATVRGTLTVSEGSAEKSVPFEKTIETP